MLFEGFFESVVIADVSDFFWYRVPCSGVAFCDMCDCVGWWSGSGGVCWDVVMSFLGVSGWVSVDLGRRGVDVVVFWSVGL